MPARITSILLAALPALPVAGCARPELHDAGVGTESDTLIPPPPQPEGDDGADESAGGPEYPNNCLGKDMEGIEGDRYQCAGQVRAFVRFTVDALDPDVAGDHTFELFSFFGPNAEGDSYESPKVMACCQPAAPGTPLPWQGQYKACYADLAENGCRSLYHRLIEGANDIESDIARNQVLEVAEWLGNHQTACVEEFWEASGAASFIPSSDDDTFYLEHEWNLPFETKNLKNISIQVTDTLVTGASLPEDEDDRLSCDSLRDNNDVSSLIHQGDGELRRELDTGHAELFGGSSKDVSRSIARVELASAASSCSVCSHMALRPAGAQSWVLEALSLESAGPTEIVLELGPWTVDRLAIALTNRVSTQRTPGGAYVIAPGAATFLATARLGSSEIALTIANATAIELRRDPSSGAWASSSFRLDYDDAVEGSWSAEIGAMRWR